MILLFKVFCSICQIREIGHEKGRKEEQDNFKFHSFFSSPKKPL